MDELARMLAQYGPGGLLAAMAISALAVVWRRDAKHYEDTVARAYADRDAAVVVSEKLHEKLEKSQQDTLVVLADAIRVMGESNEILRDYDRERRTRYVQRQD